MWPESAGHAPPEDSGPGRGTPPRCYTLLWHAPAFIRCYALLWHGPAFIQPPMGRIRPSYGIPWPALHPPASTDDGNVAELKTLTEQATAQDAI